MPTIGFSGFEQIVRSYVPRERTMDIPKPSAGHLALRKMEGSWEGQETMHPSQWDPKGGAAIGRNRHTLGLGGFALIIDYEQERDGKVTFTGHGVYTYDPSKNQYCLHWFDCLGSPPEVFVGGFDGDVMTLTHGGPGMHARMTYDLSIPNTLRGQMEMSPDGEEWKVLFEAVYKRTG
jgi:hypothetical protein